MTVNLPEAIPIEPLFRMTADTNGGLPVTGIPHGDMVIIDIKGGAFEGPKMKGTVLPSGGDWLKVTPGGARLDVRLVLQTDDGVTILVRYIGVAPVRGVEQRAEVAALFDAPKGKYEWLNDILAVGFSEGLGVYNFGQVL